jgi:predicted RNase H-like HicB family nuclease
MSVKLKSSRSQKVHKLAVDRPFDPDILRRAREIAAKYQVIIQQEGDDYVGRGLELPNAFEDGRTPDQCVKKTREMFVTVVAAMIEAGEVPPPPASEGKRTEQVNIRLSAEEKLVLEASARRNGHAGLAEYVRSVAIAAGKGNA